MEETNENKTNLIVNYLPQQMSDEEFENLFKKFGPMKSCKIVRNKLNGYSYGFGFVDFDTHEQAIQAIDELNGHELESKKIKVAFARPAGQDIKQANLYIKNVPNTWSQDDVRKVFEPYGNIIQVRVLGNNRGVAFVLYDLRKEAEDALEALNGKTVEGCDNAFEIKFAADKKVEKGGGNNKSSNNNNNGSGNSMNRNNNRSKDRNGNNRGGNQMNRRNNNNQGRPQGRFMNNSNNNSNGQKDGQSQYNNAIPYGGGYQYNPYNNNNLVDGVGPIRSQTNKMNRFAPFIPVQQQMMPAAAIAPPLSAYGYTPAQQPMIPFAMMPTQQMAPMQPVSQPGAPLGPAPHMSLYGAPQMQTGYAPITQNAMDNIYTVASNNLTNAANMQPQFGQPMAGMRNNHSHNNNHNNSMGNSNAGSSDDGITLFVYNIGPDSDENELKSIFEPYGQVVKCNVVRKTPGGETKGFGFVTLKDRNQADSAISGLNGSMKNGRTLQVSFKK